MAHEVESMFSVRVVPWHGLGEILADYPTIYGAKIASGLTWGVNKKPAYHEVNGVFRKIDGQYTLERDDNNYALGVVGERYEVYQNEEMWKFIEEFKQVHDVKLETAGSLKQGRRVWVLAKNTSNIQVVKGDSVEIYFLFTNSFDGSTSIMVGFVPVRVVCQNTLNMALGKSKNMYKVKHTKSAPNYLNEVQKALALASKYQADLTKVMEFFTSVNLSDENVREFVEKKLFPAPKKEKEAPKKAERPSFLSSLTFESDLDDDKSSRGETIRQNNIDAVLALYEGGAGTEIPGVRGTAYGLMNAITEYGDHLMSTRGTDDNDRAENKFVSVMNGAAHRFKSNATKMLVDYAATAVSN